jgi:hypothetical protein
MILLFVVHLHPDLLYVGGTGAFEFTKVYVRNQVRILPTRYNIIGTTGFLPKTGVLVSCPDGRLCLGTKFYPAATGIRYLFSHFHHRILP